MWRSVGVCYAHTHTVQQLGAGFDGYIHVKAPQPPRCRFPDLTGVGALRILPWSLELMTERHRLVLLCACRQDMVLEGCYFVLLSP